MRDGVAAGMDLRGMKWQVTGENCKMRSSIICSTHTIYYQDDQIKQDEMGGTCSKYGR
jgi:hypothetical protein